MISLYDRRTGNKILDLEEGEYSDSSEEILGVLPGNRLLTKNHDTLYVYSLSDGKILHKEEDGGRGKHRLLTSKNLYAEEGDCDEYSVQEWSYNFNTTTFETTGILSCRGSFLDYCIQEPLLISWRLKTCEEELEERPEKERDDDPEEHEEKWREIIDVVVHDSRTGEVVSRYQLPYGPWRENRYDEDFDPIDYYGEHTLMSEHEWTEQDIHEYKERSYWSSFSPRHIDPPIVGACYDSKWIILYNDYNFEVYDADGRSIFNYDLRGITKVWPITDTTIGIHVDSRLVEFDLEKRAEVGAVDMDVAAKERPDLFLGFIQHLNPLSSVGRSIIAGDVGKAQLWPDIFTSASPVEWYSAFRPESYWFEKDESIRVENLAQKRSETIELWHGNRKVTLEEAGRIVKPESTRSE
ncbi:hypothetical protein [Geobacter anodireducens]